MTDDICFYVLETKPHYFESYYRTYKGAQKALWEYYLSHGGSNDNMSLQEMNRDSLEEAGVIHNYGTIYEEYFEDEE